MNDSLVYVSAIKNSIDSARIVHYSRKQLIRFFSTGTVQP